MDGELLEYDRIRMSRMYHFPADYEEARLHFEATKFGYNRKKKNSDKDKKPPPLCPCCEIPINVREIGLCEATQPKIRT